MYTPVLDICLTGRSGEGFCLRWEDDPKLSIVYVYQEGAAYGRSFEPRGNAGLHRGHLDLRERERMLEHLDHCPLCVGWLADVVCCQCRLRLKPSPARPRDRRAIVDGSGTRTSRELIPGF